MLQITDIAATWMRSALSGEDEDDNQCFRIIVTGRGVQLMRGEERLDDVVAYTHDGKVVLVLDAATAEFLKDRGVDYDADTSELVLSPEFQDYRGVHTITQKELESVLTKRLTALPTGSFGISGVWTVQVGAAQRRIRGPPFPPSA